MIHIEPIVCGPMDVNAYILHSDESDACVAVDPAEAAPIQAYLTKKGLSLSHILLTHGHFDHIGGAAELRNTYSAKVCIHTEDADLLRSGDSALAALFGVPASPCEADRLLLNEDSIETDGMRITVLHTPGHTPGGVCFLLEQAQAMFTGDTLFRLSIGRSDLPGANEQLLYHSIANKLCSMQGDYAVYPGHMRASTLSFERTHNPFLRKYQGLL